VPANRRADVRIALGTSFAAAFRLAMLGTALLALVAGAIGAGTSSIEQDSSGAGAATA
jgi:hypothetical protein